MSNLIMIQQLEKNSPIYPSSPDALFCGRVDYNLYLLLREWKV
jgi:hypothetical protein